MNNEDFQQLLRRYANVLGEQFESVRIFATRRSEDGETVTFTFGSGNLMAQEGQVAEWLTMQRIRTEEHIKMRVRAEMGAGLEESDFDDDEGPE